MRGTDAIAVVIVAALLVLLFGLLVWSNQPSSHSALSLGVVTYEKFLVEGAH